MATSLDSPINLLSSSPIRDLALQRFQLDNDAPTRPPDGSPSRLRPQKAWAGHNVAQERSAEAMIVHSVTSAGRIGKITDPEQASAPRPVKRRKTDIDDHEAGQTAKQSPYFASAASHGDTGSALRRASLLSIASIETAAISDKADDSVKTSEATPRRQGAKAAKPMGKASSEMSTTTLVSADSEGSHPIRKARKRVSSKSHAVDVPVESETSRHFSATSGKSAQVHDGDMAADNSTCAIEDLGLSMAPSRRRSWTPLADDTPPSNQRVGQETPEQNETSVSFRNAISSFGYQEEPVPVAEPKPVAKKRATASTRKTKVSGVEAAAPKRKSAAERKASAAAKQAKEKPAKAAKVVKLPKAVRAKTVTDFAIAQYRQDDQEQAELPVTAFFQPASTQAVSAVTAAAVLEPGRTRGKKTATVNAVLHFQFPQPEKAQDKMRNQDFLFGTSSQLAQGDSPTTHRMVQQAIAESEEIMSPIRSVDSERSPTTSRLRVAYAPHGTSLSLAQGESNLWSRAARGSDAPMFIGSQRQAVVTATLEAEPIAIGSSVAPEDPPAVDVPPSSPVTAPFVELSDQSSPAQDNSRNDSGFVDIDDVVKEDPKTEPKAATLAAVVPVPAIERPALQVIDLNSPTSKHTAAASLKLAPTAVLCSPTTTKAKTATKASKTAKAEAKKLTAKAAKAAKAAAEKPIKAATKVTKPRAGSKAASVAAAPETPKRPRGRPRKDASPPQSTTATTKSWHDIEEISDSEPAASPPSPLRRSSPAKAAQLTLTPAPTSAVPPEDETALFAAITAAVKAQPRGTIERPSWAEKILLYDPVVLEDLTAWLAMKGVRGSGGVDLRESVVQRWCEGRSVCCLWREGLRGGVKCKY